MEVKVFRISGKMRIKGEWQKFTVEVPALKKEHALEHIYSVLGSRHKLKRFEIKIDEIREIPLEEVTNPYVKTLRALDRIVVY